MPRKVNYGVDFDDDYDEDYYEYYDEDEYDVQHNGQWMHVHLMCSVLKILSSRLYLALQAKLCNKLVGTFPIKGLYILY